MTTFYICRHGETENNKAGKTSGWVDTPLTAKGLQDVQSTANKLKNLQFDGVYSSDLGRAFMTAYLVTRKLLYSGEIIPLKALREASYGDLANLPYATVEAQYPELHPATKNTNFVPPNGESLAQMQARVIDAITQLNQDNDNKTILLVAHDGTIRAIYAQFANQGLGQVFAGSANPHDFVATFMVENGRITSYEEVVAT